MNKYLYLSQVDSTDGFLQEPSTHNLATRLPPLRTLKKWGWSTAWILRAVCRWAVWSTFPWSALSWQRKGSKESSYKHGSCFWNFISKTAVWWRRQSLLSIDKCLCFLILVIMNVKVRVAQSCPTHATPWTVAYQAPLSVGLSRQQY